MPRASLSLAAVCLLTLLIGCDDRNAIGPRAAPPEQKIELKTLTTLRANQRTLLAFGSGAQVYFLQPDADPSGAVRCVTNTGEIRATSLDPEKIAQLLGQPTYRGAIRGMVTLPGGKLLIYYSGTAGKSSLASLILYDTTSDRMSVAASSAQLSNASNMGLLIDLADAQMVRAGNAVWLWLRHVDGSAFLKIDMMSLGANEVRFARPFGTVIDAGNEFNFDANATLFGQPDGMLRIMQPVSGTVWRLMGDGRVFEQRPADNRPPSSVPPLLLPGEGNTAHQLHFFPVDDVRAIGEITPMDDKDAIRYPAFIIVGGREEKVMDRDNIVVRSTFPLHALRITNWLLDSNSGNVIAYDAMSGEIFSMKASSQ